MNCSNTKPNIQVWKKHVPTHSHVLKFRVPGFQAQVYVWGIMGPAIGMAKHKTAESHAMKSWLILVGIPVVEISFLKYNLKTTADISTV